MSAIGSQSSPCIIAGDINIDLSKSSTCSKANEYLSALLIYNFFPTIIMPTRIIPHTATLIQGFKKPGFFKKPNPAGFLGFNGFY